MSKGFDYTLAVTWFLIVVGWFINFSVSSSIARKSSARSRRQQLSINALSTCESLEVQALDYWTKGRQAPAIDSAIESKILFAIDRLENQLFSIDGENYYDESILTLIIQLRRAITSWPWQSVSRTALSPDDSRLEDINKATSDIRDLLHEFTES